MQNNVKYHKKTFENIPEDKQKRVLQVATAHFARFGFAGANINNVAEDVGVSVGSLYKYFASKEDLFLAVINEGALLLEAELSKIQEQEHVLRFFEELLKASRDFALNFPEYNQIYLNLTNQSLAQLSEKVCNKIEYITAEKYRQLYEISQQKGYVRSDIPAGEAAFCMDNLVMMFQFSFASSYYKERMKTFLGQDVEPEDEGIIRRMVEFVSRGLQVESD